MAPYREEERSELAAFKQHIEIAETLLGVNMDLSEWLARNTDDDGDLRRARNEGWGNVWEQLEEARAIVARLGRDLRVFEAARSLAGNPYLVAAGMARIEDSMRTATRAAIDALRAAVPEVVIPVATAPRTPVRPPATNSFLLNPRLWGGVGTLLALAVAALARC